MTCLIVAYQEDLHADAVVASLIGQSDLIRIDPFTGADYIDFDSDIQELFVINGEQLDFASISGVYCRLALESLDVESESPVERYAFKEYLGVLTGLLLNIPDKKWLNFPWNEAKAEGKIYPLLKAKKLGLDVPQFWVSNSTATLMRVASNKDLVVKPITDSPIAIQNGTFTDFPVDGEFLAPYTVRFNADLIDVNSVEGSAYLIQNRINYDYEIRACVIDDDVFATASDAIKSGVDIRLEQRSNERVISPPDKLTILLKHLTKELGLRHATFDIAVEAVLGKYWLIDVNPSGNWLWQEISHRLPISKTFAKALISGKRPIRV